MRYPAEWESDVLLADGSTVHVRPIRPEDADAHRAFVGGLSRESSYFRFFTPRNHLTDGETNHFVTVDYQDRFALVALVGDEIIAVARYDRRDDTSEAEVAFVVADAWQGRGLGTLLLEHLAAAARERGIDRFVADVLAENRRMLDVFHHAGFQVVNRFEAGVIQVAFAIDPTGEARERVEEREHQAEASSIRRLLQPRSVAVIGASDEPSSVGHHLFMNLLRGGFDGPVHPVNPKRDHVGSVPTHAKVTDIEGPVDLAVVAVPAALVPGVVDECAAKGVHGLVVVSAGFGETGEDGARLEREVADRAVRAGMRLVGPNCIGIVNTAIGLHATFAPYQAEPGRVAFSSQSGALGIALLDWANRLGLGISSFVSAGNKADVSGNDLLQYWEDDPDTDVILLYLESFGNPRKFNRIARRISMSKPIVAVKSGRTRAGTRAASSHTAAAASDDVAVNALFHQTGVIRVDTLDELLDVAQVLATQPLPTGHRVAIVGNSGGPGILAADACVGAGLDVPELSPATVTALRDLLGPAAAVANPVDMVASAGPDRYEAALRLVLADEQVDAVIVIYTPPLVTDPAEVAAAIARVARDATKPLVANFVAAEEVAPQLGQGGPGDRAVPVFRSPEPAARALARIADHAAWRRRDPGTVPALEHLDLDAARGLVHEELLRAPEGGWLDADRAAELLTLAGVPVAPTIRVDSGDEAVAAAERLGYPVVLKAASGSLVHKTERGGLRLHLADAVAVRDAFAGMHEQLGDEMGGGVVQPHVGDGVETIIGLVQERSFGPLVMFGMGGIMTELLGDRAFRIVPITDVDARELVASVRGAPLLTGYRGSPATDVDALCEILIRVGILAERLPELVELDLNPVIVSPLGAVAVDVKARIAPWHPGTPELVRRVR